MANTFCVGNDLKARLPDALPPREKDGRIIAQSLECRAQESKGEKASTVITVIYYLTWE